MNSADVVASLPLVIVPATSIAVMIAIAVRRNHEVAAGLSLLGLLAALVSLPFAASALPRQVTTLLILDSYALFYIGLLVGAAAFVLVFAFDYLKGWPGRREEFYILVLLATTGSMVLAVSRHFASLFLGLELLSVALYALIAYLRTGSAAIEAGTKYLVLAASSSAFLLFGLALIYAESGSMELSQFGPAMRSTSLDSLPLLTGLLLVLTGVGFKLAIVPFHLWTADVYEGALLPVTAFIATVSKGGMFALILRWFYVPDLGPDLGVVGAPGLVLSMLAVASMLAGNLLALRQDNLKRILAFSSIAHMGYLLVALLAGGHLGATAATYYLAAYLVTILGAIGILTVLSNSRQEAAAMDAYQGLYWRRPVVAGAFTLMLLSLAGIPLTAGFLGKFYVIAAGASQARWILLLTLVATSAIGLFYYLRIIVAMYAQPLVPDEPHPPLPLPTAMALALLVGLVLLLGIYPTPLWDAIQAMTRRLG